MEEPGAADRAYRAGEGAGSESPMMKTEHKINAALNAYSLSRIISSKVQPGKRSLKIGIGCLLHSAASTAG